jgi:hypothetical protein
MVVYVDADSACSEKCGERWATAFANLSEAIEHAVAAKADEIWVAEGTYQGTIRLPSGLRIIGGFAGGEEAVVQSRPHVHRTIISGGGTTRAVVSTGTDSSTQLRGFYITGGFTDFPDTGAGAYLEKSDAMFVDCVFTENKAGEIMGGAVSIWGGSPTFVNCRFRENDGGWAAGAVYIRRSATPSFVNCLFHDNKAMEAGAVCVITGTPRFINCTLADNISSVGKGGAIFDSRGEAVFTNCVLWNNVSPVTGAGEIYNSPVAGGKTTVSHSVVKGAWSGEGNLDADPLFAAAKTGDYRIQAGSPCRDKGLNSLLPADVADLSFSGNTGDTLPFDLDSTPRVYGSSVDLGAFEWRP